MATGRGTRPLGHPAAKRARSQRWTTVADLAAPVLVFGAVFLSRDRSWQRSLVGEDGAYEWAQVLALAVAASILARVGLRSSGLRRVALLASAGATLVVIGEELAWGTRLFGSGVEIIESHNVQGDTTLHNLNGGLELSFVAMCVCALGLAILVALRPEPLRAASLTLAWWFLGAAAFCAYRAGAGDVSYEVAKHSEAAELVFALAVLRLSAALVPNAADNVISRVSAGGPSDLPSPA